MPRAIAPPTLTVSTMANATAIRHILDDDAAGADTGEGAPREEAAAEMMRPLEAWGYSIHVDLNGAPEPAPRAGRRRRRSR